MTPCYRSHRATIYLGDCAEVMGELKAEGWRGSVVSDPMHARYKYLKEAEAAAKVNIEADMFWHGVVLQWFTGWLPLVAELTHGRVMWCCTNVHYLGYYVRVARFMRWPWRGIWPSAVEAEVVVAFGEAGTDAAAARAAIEALAVSTYGMDKSLTTLRAFVRACPKGPILDPFMGGGNTLIAGLAEGRHVVGIETVEATCERAVRRVQAYEATGEVVV